MQASVSVNHGTISPSSYAGIRMVSDGIYRGGIVELQQAFNNLKYLPHENWYGMDTVVFTLNDLGNHGLGSAKNTTKTIAVSVKSQNDPPKITIPANYYDAQEDVTLQIDGVNVFDVDSNDGLYSVRMYARNGYIRVDTNLSTVAISNITIAIEDTSVSPLYGGSVALQKVTAVDLVGPYFAVKAGISNCTTQAIQIGMV